MRNLKTYDADALNPAANNTNSGFTYKLLANGMRYQALEDMDSDGTPERTITYWYDNLNRVVREEGVEEEGTYDYSYVVTYEYDLVGNRTGRTVEKWLVGATDPIQSLVSEYAYDEVTDRLLTEKHDQPVGAVCIVHDGRRYFAYTDGERLTHYTEVGSGERIGQFRAFLLGLPSRWGTYLLRTVLGLLPATFLLPILIWLVNYRLRRQRRLDRRLSLLDQCLLVTPLTWWTGGSGQ